MMAGYLFRRNPRDSQVTSKTRATLPFRKVVYGHRQADLNAYAEWFVKTIKGKLSMIFFGDDSLRNAIHERNHQGLGNRLIIPIPQPDKYPTRWRVRALDQFDQSDVA